MAARTPASDSNPDYLLARVEEHIRFLTEELKRMRATVYDSTDKADNSIKRLLEMQLAIEHFDGYSKAEYYNGMQEYKELWSKVFNRYVNPYTENCIIDHFEVLGVTAHDIVVYLRDDDEPSRRSISRCRHCRTDFMDMNYGY